jgi:DNA-binding MarR family transcriptional regulator
VSAKLRATISRRAAALTTSSAHDPLARMLKPPTHIETRLAYDILTYVGIIEHLTRTRAEKGLRGSGVTFPQFVMLNHFRRRPADEPKTVTSIARAMQQPQPGVTKTLQKMLAQGLLKAADAPGDGRSRLLSLTAKGNKAHEKALAVLSDQFRAAFADWREDEMADLFRHLARLKGWMDTEGRK